MQKHNVKAKVMLNPSITKEKTVTLHRLVKVHKEADDKYDVSLMLDFTSCKVHHLMDLAANTAWIRIQSLFRDMAKENDGVVNLPVAIAKFERTWDVLEEIISRTGTRTPVGRVTAADRAVAKLTPAEKQAVFAKHLPLDK